MKCRQNHEKWPKSWSMGISQTLDSTIQDLHHRPIYQRGTRGEHSAARKKWIGRRTSTNSPCSGGVVDVIELKKYFTQW